MNMQQANVLTKAITRAPKLSNGMHYCITEIAKNTFRVEIKVRGRFRGRMVESEIINAVPDSPDPFLFACNVVNERRKRLEHNAERYKNAVMSQ